MYSLHDHGVDPTRPTPAAQEGVFSNLIIARKGSRVSELYNIFFSVGIFES